MILADLLRTGSRGLAAFAFILTPVVALSSQQATISMAMPRVVLEDQFGRSHELGVSPHAIVVLIADRAGADGIARWLPALVAAAGNRLPVVAVANLKGAPRLLHGLIRGKMPRDTTLRILLDWNGDVGARLQSLGDHLTLARFGDDGIARESLAVPIDHIDSTLIARVTTTP